MVYVIGIPLLLFGGLHKGAPLQLAKPVFKARYGFLYLRYERECALVRVRIRVRVRMSPMRLEPPATYPTNITRPLTPAAQTGGSRSSP